MVLIQVPIAIVNFDPVKRQYPISLSVVLYPLTLINSPIYIVLSALPLSLLIIILPLVLWKAVLHLVVALRLRLLQLLIKIRI